MTCIPLRRNRAPDREIPPRSRERRAGEVGLLQTVEGEAGGLDEPRDVAGEVAAAEEALLEAVEAVLPAGDVGIGGEAVFEEAEGAAGAQDAAQLGQGAADVGDRAQRERDQPRVDRGVGDRELGAVEADAAHWDR